MRGRQTMRPMTSTVDIVPPTESTDATTARRESASVPTWADFHALEQRLEGRAVRRDGWTLSIFAFAAIAVIFSIIGMGFGSRAIDDAKRTVRAASAPTAASSVAPVTLAASPGSATLSDYR